MGSVGEETYNGIDGSVGALVWVRRRNGSWWPGRILSRDELPERCLPAPRSGSPVKLLGREGASVDWYNIEKSKRVKAFRCGEYDDCIEKAKAFASHLSNKSVKYAHREDAILHALKLENGKDYSSTRHNTQEESQHLHTEEDHVNQELVGILDSQSVVSFEEPKTYLKSRTIGTPNDDDGAKRVKKRMKGDLGACVDFKRRKRSQVGQGHKFLKKKNKHWTLSKVMERKPMVFVPVVCEQLSSPTGLESNEININNNSDSTNGISCEKEISNVIGICEDGGSCERLFDVPLVVEAKQKCEGMVLNRKQISYRSQHVPYISLMSKLNRKPIVGHPLSVEVMEDGYLGSECYSRLSKRKQCRRPPSKRRSKGKSKRKQRLSKKIRKLSSLTVSQRRSHCEKKLVLESLKGPSIACVPLNVIFSRINATLNSMVRPQPRLSISSGS